MGYIVLVDDGEPVVVYVGDAVVGVPLCVQVTDVGLGKDQRVRVIPVHPLVTQPPLLSSAAVAEAVVSLLAPDSFYFLVRWSVRVAPHGQCLSVYLGDGA